MGGPPPRHGGGVAGARAPPPRDAVDGGGGCSGDAFLAEGAGQTVGAGGLVCGWPPRGEGGWRAGGAAARPSARTAANAADRSARHASCGRTVECAARRGARRPTHRLHSTRRSHSMASAPPACTSCPGHPSYKPVRDALLARPQQSTPSLLAIGTQDGPAVASGLPLACASTERVLLPYTPHSPQDKCTTCTEKHMVYN